MIRGFFDLRIYAQPQIIVLVRIASVRPEWIPIPFIVDTGAARTCIHALDATRMLGMAPASLDPASWASVITMKGVGGSLSYRDLPAEYRFMGDDGATELIESTIRVGEIRSQSLPSLLGCDILRHFHLEVQGTESVTLGRLPLGRNQQSG